MSRFKKKKNEMLRVCRDHRESLLCLHASGRGFCCTCRRPSINVLSVHDGQHDRVAEVWRRCERHCNRDIVPACGGQDSSASVAACAPFQLAFSTRAGVDCVGHAVRAATDAHPMTTVLSVDGIGAYDHVYCVAMMSELLEVPSLRHLLSFVTGVWFRHVLFVARCRQAKAQDPPTRRGRTRRPTVANVVLSRHSQRVGG